MRSCRAASAPEARGFDVRRRGRWYGLKACCRSSVVEHSLGKILIDLVNLIGLNFLIFNP